MAVTELRFEQLQQQSLLQIIIEEEENNKFYSNRLNNSFDPD